MMRVRLHHVVDGPPAAPVVVLLHAIGTSHRMWDPQINALVARHRVVRVDLRGHGQSTVPAGPYSVADLGGDVLGLLDDLDIGRAAVCGLSLGAMVGLWLGANAAERVWSLVCCCVVAHAAAPQAWRERAATVRSSGTEAVSDLVIERWGYTNRDSAIERLVREMLAATPAEGYASCCDAIAALDLRTDLPRITAPTLLLAGADDPSAPPDIAAEISSRIHSSRVEVVGGAAHLANVERPEAVTEAITRHLLETAQ
jgi:3-oxoadipate enol-lactonase